MWKNWESEGQKSSLISAGENVRLLFLNVGTTVPAETAEIARKRADAF